MICVTYGRYTNEGIQGLVNNPHSRAEAVEELLDAHGGRLISFYMLFNGDIDFVIVSEVPADKMADINMVNALLVRSSGSIHSITTLPAVRADDAVRLMRGANRMASDQTYRAPAGIDYFPREGL